MRFIHIDRILEIRFGESIRAVKCVTLSDDVFNEHFPGFPIYPGSLLMESLAQAGGLFMMSTLQSENKPPRICLLVMVNRLKLKKPIVPGDRAIITGKLVSRLDTSFVMGFTVDVEGETRAAGELTFGLGGEASGPNYERLRDMFMPCFSE